MKTLKARVLGVLESQPYRMKGKSGDQSKNTIINFWRMRVSYLGPETLYEVELREPLKSLASKKYTVGLNGSLNSRCSLSLMLLPAMAFRSMHTNSEKKSSKEADWRYCHKLCIGDGRILVEMIG